MGYESRIFITERIEWPDGTVYANKIATVDMCKMGYSSGFHELFDKPIDYKVFVDEEHETDKDLYGDHLKYASIQTVIDWLENQIEKDDYSRLPVLLGLLKGFDPGKWHDLQVVHFGY